MQLNRVAENSWYKSSSNTFCSMAFLIRSGRYIRKIASCASLSPAFACSSSFSKSVIPIHLLPQFPEHIVIRHFRLFRLHVEPLSQFRKGKLAVYPGKQDLPVPVFQPAYGLCQPVALQKTQQLPISLPVTKDKICMFPYIGAVLFLKVRIVALQVILPNKFLALQPALSLPVFLPCVIHRRHQIRREAVLHGIVMFFSHPFVLQSFTFDLKHETGGSLTWQVIPCL